MGKILYTITNPVLTLYLNDIFFAFFKPDLYLNAMKTASRPLIDFIEDHHLVIPEDNICFKATVQFNINGRRGELISDVQIITITEKDIDVIYLMSPEIKVNDLPDFYPGDRVAFSYFNNQCLIIKGISPQDGEYIISLFPLDHYS